MLSDLEKWLDEFGFDYEESGDDWYMVLCPFHEDNHPSGFINKTSGVFHCKSCGAKGDVYALLAAKVGRSRESVIALCSGKSTTLPQDRIYKQHEALIKNKKIIDVIAENKGLNEETIVNYILGWDKDRVSIPIFDEKKNVVNVRRWSPKAKKFKVINAKGYGGRRLYPIEALEQDKVILAEGELKALLLRQLGFNAVSPTGGAGTWTQEWNKLFKGKIVYVLYDIDKPGRSGSQRVATQLNGIAKELYIITLPMNVKEFPKGDITDYVVALGHGPSDIQALLDGAEEWKPIEVYNIEDPEEDGPPERVSLAQSSNAKYFLKSVESQVVVSAKDIAPYIVPCEFDITCLKDKEYCGLCPVNASELKARVKISEKHPVLLELIDIQAENMRRVLKRVSQIPRACDEFMIDIARTINVEEVRLIPQLNIGDDTHVVRRAFYVGSNLETNTTYQILAKVVPEPKTQYATLLIYEAKPSVDSLSIFKLNMDLSAFEPDRWTIEGLDKKFTEIYGDLSANVTRIYERQNLHMVVDLAYHSPLYLNFQGQRIKGWVEALILGDSGQGKSECSSKMMSHYGLGEKVDAKGASVAGLIGGLQETARRWFVSWGVITLQDRRLVILEEVKGLATEVIAKLTEVRSSGVAEVSKIEKAMTNARTRLIWISNPRSDRKLLSYNFGVEAIKELIGALEDVRRFDLAIIVTSGEVDRRIVNLSDADKPKAKHVFTKELCQNLILWGWSRNVDQIKFDPKATQMTLDLASDLGKTYVSNIPLVEAADQRLKLARISAALAVRTYSHDGDCVRVRPCHVEYAANFLDKLYSADTFGYYDYSRMIKTENELRDEEEVAERMRGTSYAKDVVRSMLDTTNFTAFDVTDWTEYSLEESRGLVGFLVRKNALKRARRGYMKTVAFIALLKQLEREDLKNEDDLEDSEI